jgi:hypothetical protein
MDGRSGVRRTIRRVVSILASISLVAGLLAMSAGTAVAATSSPKSLICSGGDLDTFSPELIKSGTYSTITVTGFCAIESGATVVVTSGLIVAPGGFLVASGALDNFGQFPDCNRTITVADGITVGSRGSLFLGDGPGSGCQTNTKTTVKGGLKATGPALLLVHGVTINGGLYSRGGSGPLGGPICFPDPELICPFWTAIEDNRINGNVTVEGYDGFWFGFIRNQVNGSVNLNDNVLVDTDGNEYVSNTIHGRLACAGNSPAPWVGDSQGDPNRVTGPKTGQCVGL